MKVIRVGTSCQSRVAQACDRCRSKKIRCDGIRPSCTQCINVGFECKTSDKLSRRAFPRGYTELLEERVRALETEVRELKGLLDEQDEKIDMLSRIHSRSPKSQTAARRPSLNSPAPPKICDEAQDKVDDTFKVHQTSHLLNDLNHDSYFVGSSAPHSLVEAFKQSAQEAGRLSIEIDSAVFFGADAKLAFNYTDPIVSSQAPPRLISDQLVSVFFQEWAPLFPILHRPSFLAMYEQYITSPDSMSDPKSIAKLNLVFGIAAISSDHRDGSDVDSFETQWQSAVMNLIVDNDMETLQCLVLAQIFCLLRADYSHLLKYKGLAVGLAQRLGLHQSQKHFALDALTCETRKKTFWSLYTVDRLSAAHLGLPNLIPEWDVHCEYPVDTDDEYVTEKGFLPASPGDYTKLSSALALFRLSRILSRVLTDLYPGSASYDLSFRTIATLVDDLDDWQNTLAPHLKLSFAHHKPSTNTTSSRSPLLSLAYYYTKTLVYRPAIAANLGDKASQAIVAVGDACKHMVQIIGLLDERKLSFSFCLNRNEVLMQAGFGLLSQALYLTREGKLIEESNRLVCSVMAMLERGGAAGYAHFCRIGYDIVGEPHVEQMSESHVEQMSGPCAEQISGPRAEQMPALPRGRNYQDHDLDPSLDTLRATQKSLQDSAKRFSSCNDLVTCTDAPKLHRVTPPLPSVHLAPYLYHSSTCLSSTQSEPPRPSSERTLSPFSQHAPFSMSSQRHLGQSVGQLQPQLQQQPCSTYYMLPLLEPLVNYTLPETNSAIKSEISTTDWERLLSSLDNGQTNIYDTIYGGSPPDVLIDVSPSIASKDGNAAWSANTWNWSHYNAEVPPPQSIFSVSDESFSGGEDINRSSCGYRSTPGSEGRHPGILFPSGCEQVNATGLDGTYCGVVGEELP